MRIPSLILFMLCVLMARADIGVSFSADPAGVAPREVDILPQPVHTMRFAVDPSFPAHTISLTGINPGMIVQRVTVNHGGLRPTYVGPSI